MTNNADHGVTEMTTVTINGVEYAPISELPTTAPDDPLAPLVGRNVFIRTVTMHHTGRLVAVTADMLVLDDAAWVADAGRLGEALASGNLNEVEPFPGRVFVGRGALVDMCEWAWDLPRAAK